MTSSSLDQRRNFLKFALGGASLLALSQARVARAATAGTAVSKISRSNAEWKKLLTSEQYYILREEGTERPYTSELLKEKRTGTFACVACDLSLFASNTKFESGTGWPSFYQAIEGHVETKIDYKIIVPRTEYHCARCGGHHGHVFEDGPKPTGLRYCNNGVALKFIPASA